MTASLGLHIRLRATGTLATSGLLVYYIIFSRMLLHLLFFALQIVLGEGHPTTILLRPRTVYGWALVFCL